MKERIFYLDSMRAVLMLLGIVIHSAQIFSPRNIFPVNNIYTTEIMYYLVQALHTFRMPAFFVVSGFFCYMTLKKYGRKKFLKLRIKRIIIPLLTTLFTLNLAQFIFLKNTGIVDVNFTRYLSSGRYIEHLWFLVDLIYFFVITALLHGGINRLATLKVTKLKLIYSAYIIFILPFISIFIMSLNKIGVNIYSNYWGIFSPYSLMYNYTFFLFGYFLCRNKELYNSYINKNIFFYLFVLLASSVYYQTEKKNIFDIVSHEYAYVLAQWCCIALCFKVFKSLFDKPSDLSRSISESSYTVYLFHFSILMIFGSYLVRYNLNPILGFIITVSIVSFASILVHYKFIEKSKVLRFLYNGK